MSCIAIYLNDHLAGATGGLSLVRRIAATHRDSPAADALKRLVVEIAEDRGALLELMAALNVPVRRYKLYGALIAERLGRFKPNGYLVRRSPLSSVVELEALLLGIEGKAAGWRLLRGLAERDDRLDPDRLSSLIDRARHQARTVENLRREAGAAFAA